MLTPIASMKFLVLFFEYNEKYFFYSQKKQKQNQIYIIKYQQNYKNQ